MTERQAYTLNLSAGIQDAHNLAWKLAEALKQDGRNEKLLNSYEAERRPVAIVGSPHGIAPSLKQKLLFAHFAWLDIASHFDVERGAPHICTESCSPTAEVRHHTALQRRCCHAQAGQSAL